ncbi:MAG: hypothetical protein Q9215_005701 [Flavoplaca cf. flavocitrina]
MPSKPLKIKLADQWDRVRLLGRKLKYKIRYHGDDHQGAEEGGDLGLHDDEFWASEPVREEKEGVEWEIKEAREIV